MKTFVAAMMLVTLTPFAVMAQQPQAGAQAGRGAGRGAPPRSIAGLTASSELMTTHIPLAERIAHTDPARYNVAASVHAGSGPMNYMALHDSRRDDKFKLGSNFLFLHRGIIPAGGGIGVHFHNTVEEMFVIFDGEADFTVDGRTSVLRGPAGAPVRLGHSHSITNQSGRTIQWMNINISSIPGYYDAFDMGDGHTGATKDAIPNFMNMKLDRSLLRPIASMEGGQGTVQYRRALDPSVFATAWSFVDHYLLPPGASVGPVTKNGMSEVYYVMNGTGMAAIGNETAAIKEGDAVPAAVNESRAIRNNGTAPLELMVIGVARDLEAKRQFMIRGGR